jgi:opacity protein-like surface antigen
MGRLKAVAAACLAAISIAVPAGLAATPQQIYRDFADNGRLDGHYSKSDLQRAERNLVLQGYTPNTTTTKNAIEKASKKAGGVKGASKSSGVPAVKKSGGLPFTGLDLALISVGGISLLGFGAGLRRFARRTSS